MNLTLRTVSVNGKSIVFADDADLTPYPADAIKSYAFEYEEPDALTQLAAASLMADYDLRRDSNNQVPEKAQEIAWAMAFTRAVCQSLVTPAGEERAKAGESLSKAFVAKVPTSVLLTFTMRTDPEVVGVRELSALKKMREEAGAPATSSENGGTSDSSA